MLLHYIIGFPTYLQTGFVLCHVKKKSGKNTDVATGGEGESGNYNNAPDFENQPQPAHTMDVEEVRMSSTIGH